MTPHQHAIDEAKARGRAARRTTPVTFLPRRPSLARRVVRVLVTGAVLGCGVVAILGCLTLWAVL